MRLVSELRRRSVFRMTVLYLGAAWLILQVVDLLIDRGPLPDSLGPLTLTVLVIGFPIALALSWFYEVTPEGVVRDDDLKSVISAPVSGRRLDFVIIAVLAAAVLLFAFDKWWTGPPPEKSVAVLPFVPMSSGEDDGYFADGLTEEILNSLAQLPELQVTARTSSFFFKGKDVPVAKIAELLGVAHIVEGSVRRDGEKLRITSQLIRAADGFHLWSQTYDRTSEDIFAIQQDIAENVGEALNVVLDDKARKRMNAMRIDDVEAFIAYQKGLEIYNRAHIEQRAVLEELAAANQYFDRVLEARPNFAAARVLRADRLHHLIQNMISHDEHEELDLEKVKEQVEAWQTELDLAWRSSPRGNQRDILDLERTLASDDWTGLSVLFEKAMQPGKCPRINDTEAMMFLGLAQELTGKLEESLACNPLDADVIFRLALAHIYVGRPDMVLELLDRAEAAGVDDNRLVRTRESALFEAGRFDDPAVQGVLRSPSRSVERALIQGNQAEARRLAEEWWDRFTGNVHVYSRLRLALMVGDRARANDFAARIDKCPGSTLFLLSSTVNCMIWGRSGVAKGCQNGLPFDLEATPNLKARIEESGLPWPPVAFRDISAEAL